MKQTILPWYLVIINILAFLCHIADHQLKKRKKGLPPALLRMLTIFGGAPGTILAGLITGRKKNRTNPYTGILNVFWLLLQAGILLTLYGPFREQTAVWCRSFASEHFLLYVYLILVNLVTFLCFFADKVRAMAHRWRIRESVLLGLSLAGGALGGWMAMDLCHHKVKKWYFAIGVPLMLVVHVVVLILWLTGVL